MKKKNHSRDFVQLDEVRTFTSKVTCAKEIAAARSECPAATRHIETVES